MPIFAVGDIITASADSRDILNIKTEFKNLCIVEQVQLDFANQQTILSAVMKKR
jgi:hypothetical protein